MNAEIRRTQNMLVAVDEFIDDHALTPPIAKATAEIVVLKASITELATLAGNQDAGRGEWLGASADRVRLKFELRDKLGEISAIAKVLDPITYPTARAQFKLTVNGSFASYIIRGHAFLQAIGPIKAAFVEHGLAADFDEVLSDTVTRLEDAGAHTENALQGQMTGTAGMKVAAKRGVRAVRVLDSIMRPKLKSTPALLEVWKVVTKIERPPRKAKAPQTPVALVESRGLSVASSAAAGLTATALNGHEEQLAGVEPRVNGASATLVA
jgi:hypothetical protein